MIRQDKLCDVSGVESAALLPEQPSDRTVILSAVELSDGSQKLI
jgi:hypothetical protein